MVAGSKRLHGSTASSSWLGRAGRRFVAGNLRAFAEAGVQVVDDEVGVLLAPSVSTDLGATVRVRDPRVYRALALGGTMGAAEAYASGWWDSDDLTALIRIVARNREAANRLEGWPSACARLAHRLTFRLRDNWKRRSRRNIADHYDLGNDFFASFLDRTMTYSCAVFPEPESSLEEASSHKLDLICQKLDLTPGDELLEIGAGWGSLALHAAGRYGCRVVTTTISREQFTHVTQAVRQAGLEHRVTVLNLDYRDLPAVLNRQFDKVVSVEMIEAVGYRFLDRYCQVCDDLTAPGGRMLLQAIIIADPLYEAYRRSVDVIQRYIFPGGFLPSLADLRRRLSEHTAFQEVNVDDITSHYPPTLRAWRDGFVQNWSRLRTLGYPEPLLRMWHYYFCYCEGGFLERTIGDVQLLLAKARP